MSSLNRDNNSVLPVLAAAAVMTDAQQKRFERLTFDTFVILTAVTRKYRKKRLRSVYYSV